MSSESHTLAEDEQVRITGIRQHKPFEKKKGTGRSAQAVYYVASDKKQDLLKHIITDRSINNAIVFVRTPHSVDKLTRHLNKSGIASTSLQGDESQNTRVQTLANFREGRVRILVATDTAACRIDIPDFDFVINYELPASSDTYTARTGRASESGHALSLCDGEEKLHLKNINRALLHHLQVIHHPFV